MLINLSELFTVEGKEKTYTPDLEVFSFHGPKGDYEITSKDSVTLRVRNLGNRRLLLQGNARVTLGIPCDRCLEPVLVPFDLCMDEELDLSISEEERAENLNEQPYLDGYNLDVDKLLSNELLLNLPMKVLCREDCKGICNRCGANSNHTACSCEQSSPDPRMSRIQDIFQQFKEV